MGKKAYMTSVNFNPCDEDSVHTSAGLSVGGGVPRTGSSSSSSDPSESVEEPKVVE